MRVATPVIAAAIAVLALGGAAWLFRLDIRPTGAVLIILDRWTGDVQFCTAQTCSQIYPPTTKLVVPPELKRVTPETNELDDLFK